MSIRSHTPRKLRATSRFENLNTFKFNRGAGIENGFYRAMEIAEEAMVVTTPHISAIRDADKVSNILKSVGFNILNLVINRIRGDLIVSGESIEIDFIRDYLNIEIIGTVPEDDEINNQLLIGGDIRQFTPAFKSFRKLAKSLVSGKIDLYNCTKKYKGALGLIRRKLKKIV